MGTGGLRERHPCGHANRVGAAAGGDNAQLRQLFEAVIHANGGGVLLQSCWGRAEDEDIVEAGFVRNRACERDVNRTNPVEI